MTTFEHSPQSDWLATESPSMSYREDSRAKTLALLESAPELAKGHEAAYGVNALVLLAQYDRATHSLRMSQTCFLDLLSNLEDGSLQSYETWPTSGMMQNGTIYQLPTLGPGTEGGEFGYLPTPTKSADSKGSPKGRYFGSGTCFSNLREVLRDGPDDPVYPNPEFVEGMMGFPTLWTELRPWEIPSSHKSPNSSDALSLPPTQIV